MFLLFVYSMGLGVPFVFAGLAMTRAYSAFGWFKRHFTAITVSRGLLLAGFGVLMVTGWLVNLNGWFQRVLPEFLWNVRENVSFSFVSPQWAKVGRYGDLRNGQ